MVNSTPPRWMKPRVRLALALICAAAPLSAAADAAADTAAKFDAAFDAHLNIVPRTEAERARIDAVTAPPAGFAAPEPFEVRSAGPRRR